MSALGRFRTFANGCLRPRADKLNRLDHLLKGDAMAELGILKSHPAELFALAAMYVAEKHKECFGECKNSRALDERIQRLREERTER